MSFMGLEVCSFMGMLMFARMRERKAALNRVSRCLNLLHTWRM